MHLVYIYKQVFCYNCVKFQKMSIRKVYKSSMEGILSKTPLSFWKFQLKFKHPFISLSVLVKYIVLHHPEKFQSHLCGEYGYFLEKSLYIYSADYIAVNT